MEAAVSYGGRSSNGELFEVLLGYPTNGYCGHFWGSLMDTADSGSGDQPVVSWNTWTMVTMTYDGTTVQLYQDAVLKRTADLALNTTPTYMYMYIGGGHGSGGQWDYDQFAGQIDDVRFYGRALPAAEVSDLFNLNPPPVVSITNPAEDDPFFIGESVTIDATAIDDGTVTKVEFFYDGNLIGEDTGSPWTIDWNTTGPTPSRP